jgi:uncharacterized protein (DUF427 family)
MGVRLRDSLTHPMDELRFEPTEKRVRAELDGQTVVDSVRALLVWEPRRVVPTYAVPADDVRGDLVAAPPPDGAAPEATTGFAIPDVTALRVFDPRIPFAIRRTPGEPVELRAAGTGRTLAGFRPADADLAGYVVLDFGGADRWLEEDEEIAGHPRDPFHRVDVRASSRHVQLSLDGRLLAESSRPALVFETMLPPRYYLPRDDVTVELIASGTRTWCAYKGEASYFSVDLGDRVVEDLAWSYRAPLPDAVELGGRIAFFDERVDLVVDGVPRPRPVTPWS